MSNSINNNSIEEQKSLNKRHLLHSFTSQEFPLDWSMSRSERFCLIHLLQKIKPTIAIEIGTYNGGSLQVISKYADKVYAIDTDSTIKQKLQHKFENVEFLIGDSKSIVPDLIKELSAQNKSIEFALIDGDHSYEGVFSDISNVLQYKPQKDFHILLHDSFNPECRRGMKAYDYEQNKNVHYVELDYITGTYYPDGAKREMWGGLAYILVCPEKRTFSLKIGEDTIRLYNITYKRSIHYLKKQVSFLKPIYHLFKK